MNDNNETPMIPKHQHQAEMMHLSRAIKSILIISVSAFLAMVIMAYIFVSGYTSRTKDILNTINNMKVYTIEETNNGHEKHIGTATQIKVKQGMYKA